MLNFIEKYRAPFLLCIFKKCNNNYLFVLTLISIPVFNDSISLVFEVYHRSFNPLRFLRYANASESTIQSTLRIYDLSTYSLSLKSIARAIVVLENFRLTSKASEIRSKDPRNDALKNEQDQKDQKGFPKRDG